MRSFEILCTIQLYALYICLGMLALYVVGVLIAILVVKIEAKIERWKK